MSDARSRLIEEHPPLVTALARRCDRRGEQLEDPVQVGALGLIKAVDRLRPERGVALGAFATPTIVGEIKHHLRYRTWPLRVPRRLRESSSPSDFVTPVAEAETAASEDGDTLSRADDRALVESALSALDERTRRLLELRFFAELSQAEIASQLGLSQVHVSRLLRDGLARLRGAVGPREPELIPARGSSSFGHRGTATNGGAR